MKKLPNLHAPDVSRREELLHHIERLTELPLLILAFAMIIGLRSLAPQRT